MKRFWLVMLSLGLVLAFSASAMAVDVKFSGSFYAAGMYLDKTKLQNGTTSAGDGSANVSTAFYYQRLRVQTDFIVSPGLKLVTRFDAMERAWGAARSTATNTESTSGFGNINTQSDSAGTAAENENIAFDLAYVQWLSPIGYFMVGYQDDGSWGTTYGDSSAPLAKVQFATQLGPVTLAAYMGKVTERSNTAKFANLQTDTDTNKYVATAEYTVNKDIKAGMLYALYDIKAYKGNGAAPLSAYGFPGSVPLIAKAHALNPYAKAKFGPVSIEAELLYLFGTVKYETDGSTNDDVGIGMLSAYVGAMADLGPVYFGANLAYISGDDPGTTDKWEGGQIGGGFDWNPCLIMFNRERTNWAGAMVGHGSGLPPGSNAGIDSSSGLFGPVGMTNAWFAQGIVGGRPIAALDIRASLAYAAADQKPAMTIGGPFQPRFLNGAYGWELDVTGTYKITNNLSYMLGVGYLWTGDYFKADSNENSVQNNYLLINKLTLTF